MATWSKDVCNDFFIKTVAAYSKAIKRQMRKIMVENGLITTNPQIKTEDAEDAVFINSATDEEFWSLVSHNDLSYFFEYWEYTKLYKYSVPFGFKGDISKIKAKIDNVFNLENKVCFLDSFGSDLENSVCSYYEENDYLYVKFVIQKNYPDPKTYEAIDYRYPIILAINKNKGFCEIRYDCLKFDNRSSMNNQSFYTSLVDYILNWIKSISEIELYYIDGSPTIEKIKSDTTNTVKIYKQLMELKSGGSAELRTSENRDYVLPFIGELRELIDENEKLFDESPKIKELLNDYLDDKEATSNYPYVYVKWIKPVESQSYIVKIVFSSYMRTMVQLQHITNKCTDLRKERMNNAIEYLFSSGSFVCGQKI